MSKRTMVPFIKWVGGKSQLEKELLRRVPESFNTYFEPFLGGGFLFLTLQPKKAIVGDINKELINAYFAIKNNILSLREYLLLLEKAHSENFFLEIRSIDITTSNHPRSLELYGSDFKLSRALMAARFIYLNKAGFNGMYRVNSKGNFNIPSSKRKHVKTFDWDNLKDISNFLKSKDIKIKCQSFTSILNKVQKGDFVYLDPPYDYEEGQNGFDAYSKESFGRRGQKRLAAFCAILDGKGVKFMLSNHNTKFIRESYKNFNIDVIQAKRLIGGTGASRQNVEEVLITNYEYKK